jgi:hypothetical protein
MLQPEWASNPFIHAFFFSSTTAGLNVVKYQEGNFNAKLPINRIRVFSHLAEKLAKPVSLSP